jgi:hypothetical protein
MRAPRSSLGLGSLLVGVLIVLALGVGTVYAAIPNGNGKYSACLDKATGAVRLINYPKVGTCPAGEKLINWNAKGPAGPQGVQGPKGDQGAQGAQGAAGITKITLTQVVSELTVAPGFSGSTTTTCPAGKVVGGGFQNEGALAFATDSYPGGPTSWRSEAYNSGGVDSTLLVYAICMTTDPVAVIARASNFKVSKKHK